MPIYLSKSLAAASSTGIGTISTAATPVVTLNTSQLDTQRRISLSATADFSATYTLTGTRQGGGSLTESIIGSTQAGAVATTQDFLTLTSVAVSSVPNVPITLGTNTVGGSPWQVVNAAPTPTNIGFGLTYSTTRTALLGQIEYGYESPTGTPLNSNTSAGIPIPFVSTSLSTAANTNTSGFINMPIACWRVTVTSTSTGTTPPAVYVSAVQAGLGSGG